MRTFTLYSLTVTVFMCSLWASSTRVADASDTVHLPYVPLAPIEVTGSEFTSEQGGCVAPTCFPAYLRTIYNVGIALAGLFAVLSIVRGGFTLLFTDSILGHSEGKGQILRALGGLVIVYASYIFMNTINPALGRDLDLSLNFPRVTILKETGGLTVADPYSEFLDQSLEKIKAISTKAQDIKKEIDLLYEKKVLGETTPAEDEKLAKLMTQEVDVRAYENRVAAIDIDRTNMQKCLSGKGPCLDTSGYWTVLRQFTVGRSAADIAADQQTAQLYVDGVKAAVAKDAVKLRAAGLEDRAKDLESRVETTQKILDFSVACGNAPFKVAWKKGDTCPPSGAPDAPDYTGGGVW